MQDSEEGWLRVSARLAAHERLIRDLFVMVTARTGEPLGALDAYVSTLEQKLPYATAQDADPAQSDLMNQLVSEALRETLRLVRSDITRLVIANQRRKGQKPK
jgi:hypothetical protein